jgi:dTDP-4-amino-4,6-dideoxygalactose transaminase
MLTTACPDLDRRFRRLRQHAMSVPDTVRHAAAKVQFEQYDELGFNYRMSDVQAAIGRVQLRRLPELLAERAALAGRYAQALQGVPGLAAPAAPPYARPNHQSYPVRCRPPYPHSRDALMQRLLDRGVSTRRGIMNAHQEPAYAAWGPYRLPHSEDARDNTILLPLYAGMTDVELQHVMKGIAP